MSIYLLPSIFIAGIAVWYLLKKHKQHRRANFFSSEFPAHWDDILKSRFPLYRGMPNELKKQLQGHINVFVSEKNYYGCNGLELTDEMIVTIAAQACILILNKKTDYFPNFKTILVYPEKFTSMETHYDGHIEVKRKTVRLGESWHRGPVIISWQDAKAGAENSSDGDNVVIHEFAHKLDEQNPDYQGLPLLNSSSHYQRWAKVMSKEYEKLGLHYQHGHKDLIDHYGASSPAEFFAVITELFFEKPDALSHKHPALYTELERFYRVNPKQWHQH